MNAKIFKFLKPVIVREGEMVPWGYSMLRYVPRVRCEDGEAGFEIYEWEKVCMPIPVSIVLNVWYRMKYFVLWGCRIPPEMYTSKNFVVMTHCPHCKEPFKEEHERKIFGGNIVRFKE